MIRADIAYRVGRVYSEAKNVEIVLVRHSFESKQRSGDGWSWVEQLTYPIGTVRALTRGPVGLLISALWPHFQYCVGWEWQWSRNRAANCGEQAIRQKLRLWRILELEAAGEQSR